MKILVDTMGSDKGSHALVTGAMNAATKWEFEPILVGDEQEITNVISEGNWKIKPQIIGLNEVISNDESPTLAIRRKKDSSMVKALELLRDGHADGMVSAGSTGALLAGGMLILKRINGLKRAALTSIYPTTKGMSLLVDAGANVELTPETLTQFAIMASIYYSNTFNITNPRVALVNVGTEKGKGHSFAQETYGLLEKSPVNFIGNIEAREIPFGGSDIIVCDGFTGNIILKLTEGMALAMVYRVKKAVMSSFISKVGALLIKPALTKMKKDLDYREYGGVPLLGLTAPVFKAHGSSDDYAVENAIGRLIDFIKADVIKQLEVEIKGE
ncbi:MAG: phosphate acyltransferase PlsX [Tissierellia bacterium]|nr:phosphate acyltransferase PlsX [Tissierellia bacterium]